MSISFLLALFTTDVMATEQEVRLCAVIGTNFTDPGGEFWVTNEARLARGASIFIGDDDGSTPGWQALEEDSCVDTTVIANSTHYVTVYSQAEVNSITLKSYEVQSDGSTEQMASVTSLDIPIAATSHSIVIPGDQTWYNLAVGMFAFHRNDMNLGTYSARGCCHNEDHGWYDDDGSCLYEPGESGSSSGRELYGASDNPTEIIFINESYSGAGCCSSLYDPTWDDEIPAVVVRRPWKFMIAHELGHVIVEGAWGTRRGSPRTLRWPDAWGATNPGASTHPTWRVPSRMMTRTPRRPEMRPPSRCSPWSTRPSPPARAGRISTRPGSSTPRTNS